MSDITLVIHRADGTTDKLTVKSRIDTGIEVDTSATAASPLRPPPAPWRVKCELPDQVTTRL